MRHAGPAAVAVSLSLAFACPAFAAPTPSPEQCFRSHGRESFQPIDDHSFNVRTNTNDIFRVETEGSCSELTTPFARLVNVVRGSDLVCGPLDWDLQVGSPGPGGFVESCRIKSQRRLTPAEIAAMPPSQRP